MSEPLFVVRNAANAVVFDSRLAYAGVCVGIVDVPAATAMSVSYPGYTGHTLKALSVSGISSYGATIDTDGSGYPRVNFVSGLARSYVMFIQ